MQTTTVRFRHRMGDEVLERDFATDAVTLGETHVRRMIANTMYWKAEDVVLLPVKTRDLLGPDNGKGRGDTSIDPGHHAHHVADLREEADALEKAHCWGVPETEKDLRVKSLRAAADLLELHDATGLNLTQAPNLAAFVEAVLEQGIGGYGVKVQDNGA